MGLSENSVPLHPMVLLIIIPIKWLFHCEYTLFSDISIYRYIYIYKELEDDTIDILANDYRYINNKLININSDN